MTEDKWLEYRHARGELKRWLSYMGEEGRYGMFDLISIEEDLREGLRRVAILLDWQKKNRKFVLVNPTVFGEII